MGELADRQKLTLARLNEIAPHLHTAEELARDKACVYVTGSFGRGEASAHSDLDLFIVGKSAGGERGEDGTWPSQLTRLDEICIKADLIEITRKLDFPEFSGDGKYLVHYSLNDLVKTLGTREDDISNTFTARLLLLLESSAIVGKDVYKTILADVVAAYWRDYPDHKDEFVPAFLCNDILRLWRTFCVNYEAFTESNDPIKKAKRKLKNYKLKHSRLLTCYSALLYLLAVHWDQRTVHPSNALDMISLTPLERLAWIMGQPKLSEAHPIVAKLVEQYEVFLSGTNKAESDLVAVFTDKNLSEAYRKAAYTFGDLMFEAVYKIGRGERFHRLLVV